MLCRYLSPIAFGSQTIFRVASQRQKIHGFVPPPYEQVYLFVCNRQIPKELRRSGAAVTIFKQPLSCLSMTFYCRYLFNPVAALILLNYCQTLVYRLSAFGNARRIMYLVNLILRILENADKSHIFKLLRRTVRGERQKVT